MPISIFPLRLSRHTAWSLLLGLSMMPATWAQPPESICQDLDSPGLLMGGGQGKPLCDWFDAPAVLVVNTASRCGFTPQFHGLEALHQEYGPKGLAVLGFPSDNFAGQEYDDPEQTAKVCYRNYGVSFPMFRKVDVRGQAAHPLFQRLSQAAQAPKWNFHKFLITPDGIQSFRSAVEPQSEELQSAIRTALKQP